jgi:hypothetical protein
MAIKTFTTGELLTASDTNTYLANSGLVYIKQQTIGSGVATAVVADAFSATYDNYKITIHGGVASTLTSLTFILTGSATQYYSALSYVAYGTTTPLAASDNNAASWQYAGYGTTNYLAATFDVLNPWNAKFTQFGPNNWPAQTVSGTSSGVHGVATSYTGFTIGTAAGTMTGGTITVYGYRKA